MIWLYPLGCSTEPAKFLPKRNTRKQHRQHRHPPGDRRERKRARGVVQVLDIYIEQQQFEFHDLFNGNALTKN
jgi:hypothetical protein